MIGARRIVAQEVREEAVESREVAALFYTLIESAKLAGVEPGDFLAEATRRAINNPGTVTLPRDLAPA